jgi:hypothetical protein
MIKSWVHKYLYGSAVVLALTASVAYAAPQDVIDQRLEHIRVDGLREVTPEEASLTGRDDLVLMQERKFFSVAADAGSAYTSNAYLSDQYKKSDVIFNGRFSGHFATRIDQKYDVFAEAGIVASRYKNQNTLGYNALTGAVGAETVIYGHLRAGVQYGLTSAFSKDGFSNRTVLLHDFVAQTNYPLALDQDTGLIPQLAINRTLALPSDYQAWTFRGSVNLVHRFHPTVLGVAGVEASYKAYDNYFERITAHERHDTMVGLNAEMRWTPLSNVQLAAGMNLNHNESSLAANDYNALNIAPKLGLKLNF